MKTIASLSTLTLAVVLGFASESPKDGKTHEFDPAKLPKVVKIKCGDSVIVTYKIKPADIEDMTVLSSNLDVTVKGVPGKGDVRVRIHSDKKSTAKISWRIEQVNGRLDGCDQFEVEFE